MDNLHYFRPSYTRNAYRGPVDCPRPPDPRQLPLPFPDPEPQQHRPANPGARFAIASRPLVR